MRFVVTVFSFFSLLYPDKNNYLSDEWFEKDVPLTQFLSFVQKFNGSLSTSNQVALYNASKKYRINPVFVSAIMQCESGAICQKVSPVTLSRAMGYGVMDHGNHGFDKQVERGCWLLRKCFDGYYVGAVVEHQRAPWVKERKYLYPENAATYARMVYCPVEADYIEHDKNGVAYRCGGNAVFERVNFWFQKVFEGMI